MVSLKSVMQLPGRALCGFVESVFQLMQVDLSVPDHTTLSRRLKRLKVALPVVPTSGKRHVVVDSTGVKVYGEGEWKTRQHGIGKRRTWRKLHLAVDEATGEILASAVTGNSCQDGEMLGGLKKYLDRRMLDVAPSECASVSDRTRSPLFSSN